MRRRSHRSEFGSACAPLPAKLRCSQSGKLTEAQTSQYDPDGRPRAIPTNHSDLADLGVRVTNVVDHPPILLATAVVALCGAAFLGDLLRSRVRPVKTDERADLDIVLTATLTLLGLLLGFTFSMAVSRYDQRKTHEAAETNAIATEYRRADLIPGPGRIQERELLTRYTDERIRYYRNGEVGTGVVDQDLRTLQNTLWSGVAHAANAQRDPVSAVVVSGMDDVFNSRGTTRAAWLNRIPAGAWALLATTALVVTLLLGYRERRRDAVVLTVLPLVVSIALFLIADIDSPREGLIRVAPINLVQLSDSMHAQD